MDELQMIIAMVGDVGVWALFAFLFYQERQRVADCQEARVEDLRDIAGVRPQLRHPAAQGDTQQLPDMP